MPEHRGHNEGTYVKRPSGRWQAQVTVNGRRSSQTFDSKKEAQAWVRKQQTRADQGLLPVRATKLTLGEYLAHWLKANAHGWAPKTYEGYELMIRLHIAPRLGNLRLTDLRPDHLQSYYAQELDAGFSPSTVLASHRIMHRALEDAVKSSLVLRNVADAVNRPKAKAPEMQVWRPEETRAFLDGIVGERLEALYCVALTCGLRQAELVGLRWNDVDLDRQTLNVQRIVHRVNGKGLIEGDPKTAKGKRQILLAPATVESLRRWRVRQLEDRLLAGEQWKETGHVFTSRVGTTVEARSLNRDFDRQAARLGMRRIRFHDLRHTCATYLHSQGVPIKAISTILGHASVAVTTEVYTHMDRSMQEQAAKAMERLFSAT